MLVGPNGNRAAGLFGWSGLLLFAAGNCVGAPPPVKRPPTNVLDSAGLYINARDVRELSPKDAAKEHPASLRGVVTFADQQLGRLFVQDGSAGISVYLNKSQSSRSPHAGDFVSVDGVTAPGAFSPCITQARLNVLGSAPFPKPQRLSFDDLLNGGADADWAEVSGVVRSGQIRQGRLYLNVKVKGGNLVGVLTSYPQDWSRTYIDSRVLLSGVIAQIHYKRRQSIGVRIFVPPGFLRILERAPADPFSLPESSIDTIHSYRKELDFEHRIRVRGVVIGVEPGRSLFLSEQDGVLEVQGQPACVAQAGDVIDVVGFPGAVDVRPGMLDSICRKVSHKWSTVSLPVNAGQILLAQRGSQEDASRYDYAASSRFDMSVVRIDGTLVQNSPGPEGTVLLLASGGKQFIGTLPGARETMLPGVQIGSRLQLTGVCLLSYDAYRRAISFHILLRTPADIVVLKPAPWWNLENAMRVLSIMAVFLMAAILWVARQSFALRRANRTLRKLSFQDALTGVANRRLFDKTLETELRRASRSSTPVSLIMLDIDHFKLLNDRYGHQRGDECLVLVARALQCVEMRMSDLVARYGGEEFAIILPGSEPESALAIAENVREAVADLDLCHEGSPFLHVSISAGVATVWPDRCTTSASLIALADQALYQSKVGGRNRVSSIDANVPQGVV